jgi:hypothetical protein
MKDNISMSTINIKASPPRRTCGTCSLCCKLIHVEELKKPANQWCPHCLKSGGCGIYDTRPNVCRDWNCEWVSTPEVPDEWQPLRSKMVMIYLRDGGATKLVVHVDSGSPLAWKNEPYYSQLKRWAQKLIEQGGIVNVYVRNRVIAILPDKDVDLGPMTFGDRISVHKKRSGIGWEYDVRKEPATDAPSE